MKAHSFAVNAEASHLRFNPPLLGARPSASPVIPAHWVPAKATVELFVAHLDAFSVPAADLRRLRAVVARALRVRRRKLAAPRH